MRRLAALDLPLIISFYLYRPDEPETDEDH
jgi:hypothetical protein